jgi:hypothetical protein
MKTDDELKQLGIDLQANRIFTSTHLVKDDAIHMLPYVFMPLVFMDDEQRKNLKSAFAVYEYMNKAGPRSINGYPIFHSFQTLTEDEWRKVMEYCIRAEEALKAL